VPKKYIIGRVQLRWWPLDEARVFHGWRGVDERSDPLD
jgi:hypothetical protein